MFLTQSRKCRDHIVHIQWLCEVHIHAGINTFLSVFLEGVGGHGEDWNRSRLRISLAAVIPSITGIMISIRIAS